jgi:hypothetical protein
MTRARDTSRLVGPETITISLTNNVGIGSTIPTSDFEVTGDVRISGVVTASDYNSTSDITLKQNIHKIENSIAKIIEINGVSFNWKETNKPSMGVIAQNIEKIFPELVNGEDPKTVNYNGIIGVLIEAIKEQQVQINNLKDRISKLEN